LFFFSGFCSEYIYDDFFYGFYSEHIYDDFFSDFGYLFGSYIYILLIIFYYSSPIP